MGCRCEPVPAARHVQVRAPVAVGVEEQGAPVFVVAVRRPGLTLFRFDEAAVLALQEQHARDTRRPADEHIVQAVADVNGDGLDDVFIGGASGVPGMLFLQRKDGSFVESEQGQPWAADRDYEDWGALFFDANGDGRPDLYVASCGYRLAPASHLLQDRLYINRGGGRFVRDSRALPPMPTCTASVAAGDFTGDGRLDLFVGGRLTPRSYPNPTRSYLLRNDGGHFTDVTAQVAPELAQPFGMVTAAVWTDFDGDGKLDLVTAGEWMPL